MSIGKCLSLHFAGAGLGGQKGSAFEGLETVVAGEGQIYIYRPYKMFWLKAYPNVVVNGKLVGELRNGTYVVVNVSPGINCHCCLFEIVAKTKTFRC